MRAAALAAPTPSCLRTASDQDRVAQAFVSAALRLSPMLDHSDSRCLVHVLHASPRCLLHTSPRHALRVRP